MTMTRRLFLVLMTLFAFACDDREPAVPVVTTEPDSPPAPVEDDAGTLRLVFPYGSEKKAWLTDVTDAFNAQKLEASDGRTIFVDARPMGSGEQVTEILEGRLEAHLVSPASGLFIELGNAESRAMLAGRPLVGETKDLVLSPVVIAMWKPMAEALGWPEEPVGWRTVLDMVNTPDGWASVGHPEWGDFKYGHTHPEYSNSGLISLVAEVYAGAGKQRGLSQADLEDEAVATFLGEIERGVVHYGSSTGFFGRKMFGRGPRFLSAAVLYENMVVESYGIDGMEAYDLPFPVVAIYPSEGTFWSDHPVGIVDRDWVTTEHESAAETYIDYLLEAEQQERALAFGFRPGDPTVAVGSPINASHGVDPDEPKTVLEVPEAEVVRGVIDLWKDNKKPANVALVIDTSGSMRRENRIAGAKAGAAELVALLADRDTLSVTSFNTTPTQLVAPGDVSANRERADSALGNLFADGGTALYDAIATAHDAVSQNADGTSIDAIVVLSDGEDENSTMQLDALIAKIEADGERDTIRVFTIGYGSGADMNVLERISQASDAKAYVGTNDNIREVFKDIATFF